MEATYVGYRINKTPQNHVLSLASYQNRPPFFEIQALSLMTYIENKNYRTTLNNSGACPPRSSVKKLAR